MKTFALFADGSAQEILLGDFLEPLDDVPLKAIPININDKDVIHSAQNGFLAAYYLLKMQGYIKKNLCFAYQFAEALAANVLGPSAGLGFSLKFTQWICGLTTDRRFGSAIAATGVVSDMTDKAEVRRVEGIVPKLQAAVAALSQGDRVFYPSENEVEVPDVITKQAVTKGIELIPVSTVDMAIRRLLETFPEEAYPVVIDGLELSSKEPSTYLLRDQFRSWKKVSVPFKVANRGRHSLSVEARAWGRAAGWLGVLPSAMQIPPGESREMRIEIPAGNPLLFTLRHLWKPVSLLESELTLSINVMEQRPYEFTRAIHSSFKFVNYQPLIALLLIIIFGIGGYLGIHRWGVLDGVGRSQTQTPETEIKPPPQPRHEPPQQVPAPTANELTALMIKDLEQGRFSEARARLSELQSRYSEHAEVSRLADRMSRPLVINSELVPQSQPELTQSGTLVIASGGGFKIRFTLDDVGFLYVYQLDSHNKLDQLFPNEAATTQGNPLQAGKTYQIPAKEEDYFILDQSPGMERVHLVASRWLAKDLEELAEQFLKADETSKDHYRELLLARLKARRQSCAVEAGSCFYHEHIFQHR